MLVGMFSCIMYFVLYSLEGCTDIINFLFLSTQFYIVFTCPTLGGMASVTVVGYLN